MKQLLIIISLTCVCFGAEPNTVEIKQAELINLMDQLPQQRKQLEQKTYSGTIEQIMAQRVIDVNDVRTKSQEVTKAAMELCELSGLDPTKAEALKVVVERTRRQAINLKGGDKIIDQGVTRTPSPKLPPEPNDPNYVSEVDTIYTNSSIREAVAKMSADPNFWPDPNDPNYVSEMESTTEFLKLIEEICNPS